MTVEPKRILYLRPFRSEPDHHVVMAFATFLAKVGTLVVVGTAAAKDECQKYRERHHGDSSSPGIDYVVSDSREWKEVVHREIHKADCVLLHLAPKGNAFPVVRGREAAFPRMARFYSAPFKNLATGPGLLLEVLYLDRLRKIEQTVVVCAENDLHQVRSMIGQTSTDFQVFVSTPDGPRAPTARLWALDRQCARLQAAVGVVPFTDQDLASARSRPASKLRQAVKKAAKRSRPARSTAPATVSHPILPIGVDDAPRPLPPDNALKIISHTKVEDLVIIPPGEIKEVPPGVARGLLSRRSTWRGCPTCKQKIESIFFYTYELSWDPEEPVRGKCQRCMSYLMIQERRLIEV